MYQPKVFTLFFAHTIIVYLQNWEAYPMNFPLNSSATKLCKEELCVETSILKTEPTVDFDKELENAMNQYDELLKELVDK